MRKTDSLDRFGQIFGAYLSRPTAAKLASAKKAHDEALKDGKSQRLLYEWANEIGDRVHQDEWSGLYHEFWMPPHRDSKRVARTTTKKRASKKPAAKKRTSKKRTSR